MKSRYQSPAATIATKTWVSSENAAFAQRAPRHTAQQVGHDCTKSTTTSTRLGDAKPLGAPAIISWAAVRAMGVVAGSVKTAR
eukprot:7387764-Prymnesium_polylepis.1